MSDELEDNNLMWCKRYLGIVKLEKFRYKQI